MTFQGLFHIQPNILLLVIFGVDGAITGAALTGAGSVLMVIWAVCAAMRAFELTAAGGARGTAAAGIALTVVWLRTGGEL